MYTLADVEKSADAGHVGTVCCRNLTQDASVCGVCQLQQNRNNTMKRDTRYTILTRLLEELPLATILQGVYFIFMYKKYIKYIQKCIKNKNNLGEVLTTGSRTPK
jgi:hypothetical protein